MDAKAIKRLQQLVRLAVDSAASEAEARSAAIIACRMLVQHDVLTTLVATPARASKSKTPVEQDSEGNNPWDVESDGWDAYAGDYDQRASAASAEEDIFASDESEESVHEAPAHDVPKEKDIRRKWRLWLRIDSEFGGWCYWCNKRILKNDDILWDPSTRNCVCPRCREQFEKDWREGHV